MSNLDPMYRIVALILVKFHRAELKEYDKLFVAENTRKHANVLWLNAVAIAFVVYGLQNASRETIGQIITALIAPVMVMGGAWFAITFGGVPKYLVEVAMSITFCMFVAFSVSFSTMLVAILYSVHPVMWPAFVIIYVFAVKSCIMYDTTDGLKAGLDEAMLKHSRAALAYYQREGISPEEDETVVA